MINTVGKPIRVALSGSGFKFPAHVGALFAIRDAGYDVIELAGTSGGSIVSALYACGMTLEQMKLMTMIKDWTPMLEFNITTPFRAMGYCSGDNLFDFIFDQTNKQKFKDLKIGLSIVASDVAFMDELVFSNKNTPEAYVASAARCSASIPFAYGMMEYGDEKGVHMLMDGGLWDNMPEDKLVQDDVLRLGVRLVSKDTPLLPNQVSIKSIMPRVLDSLMMASENVHVDQDKHNGAQFAFIETGYASGLDNNMTFDIRNRLFNDGYAETKAVLANIK